MVKRDDLERYLADVYQFEKFDDYCSNGIQVEGRETIERAVFGVSFSRMLLEAAIARGADAIFVHHGIFGRDFFMLKGHRKEQLKLLLQHDISLFGIHLPMDAHPEMGHNALLFSALEAEIEAPFFVGFTGCNSARLTLDGMLQRLDEYLHPVIGGDRACRNHPEGFMDPGYSYLERFGFGVLKNGPDIPKKIAVISGGSASDYEKAIFMGADTFICGEIKEHIPALSLESSTNFINLGHYYSETPGVRALRDHLQREFKIYGEYVEIGNVI